MPEGVFLQIRTESVEGKGEGALRISFRQNNQGNDWVCGQYD
jgi:hypothetical protein